MSDWARYAEKVLGDSPVRALFRNWQFHTASLGYLMGVLPPPARVLSIGCSLGLYDLLLTAHGYSVTSVDNDPAVLEAAERLGKQFGVELHLEQADAFDLRQYHDSFDLAYSAGLVEHWHGRETTRLLREHARCADLVQVEVPTPWTRYIDSIEGVVADMHPFRPREFLAQVRKAGLTPVKRYLLGSAPSSARERLESSLPPYLFRRLQWRMGLGMDVGVIARR